VGPIGGLAGPSASGEGPTANLGRR